VRCSIPLVGHPKPCKEVVLTINKGIHSNDKSVALED